MGWSVEVMILFVSQGIGIAFEINQVPDRVIRFVHIAAAILYGSPVYSEEIEVRSFATVAGVIARLMHISPGRELVNLQHLGFYPAGLILGNEPLRREEVLCFLVSPLLGAAGPGQ